MAAHALARPIFCAGLPSQGLPLSRTRLTAAPNGYLRARTALVRSERKGSQSSAGKAAQLGEASAAVVDGGEEEEQFEDEDDEMGLTTQQVHSMLHVLCEDTEVAELELKMGSFEMRVRRSSKRGASGGAAFAGAYTNGASPIPVPAPGTAFASTASMDMPAQDAAPAPSVAVASVDEDVDDESTIFLTAPKVGVMRRGRYVKGKKVGKGNIANVGDEVKKGQPLGFIEQLGTFVPVEAPQAGEIVAFIADEGTAVEYMQPIMELVPFFGGHIIGERKYA